MPPWRRELPNPLLPDGLGPFDVGHGPSVPGSTDDFRHAVGHPLLCVPQVLVPFLVKGDCSGFAAGRGTWLHRLLDARRLPVANVTSV